MSEQTVIYRNHHTVDDGGVVEGVVTPKTVASRGILPIKVQVQLRFRSFKRRR